MALDNCVFTFDAADGAFSYSTDGGQTWSTSAGYSSTSTINAGSKVLLKGNYIWNSDIEGGYIHPIESTGRYSVEGNIMSLLYGDNFRGQTSLSGKDMIFEYFFNNHDGSDFIPNPNLISAENLILPATTLSFGCYKRMFAECTNLTTAPTLPASQLVEDCYYEMFEGCTNLNYVKCLANSEWDWQTSAWLWGVAANGTFVKAASMNSWPSGANGIPEGWTVENA